MRARAALPAVLLASSLAAPPALTFRVVDPSGAPVENAIVSVKGPKTHFRPTGHRCSRLGLCTVARLGPGLHTLTIRAAGFPTETRPNIEITAGRPTDLGDIALRLQGCGEPGVICDSILPDHPIYRSGVLEVPLDCTADLDLGKVLCTVVLDGDGTPPPTPSHPNNDLLLRPARKHAIKLVPRNHAALALLSRPTGKPESCAQASLSRQPIAIDPTRPFLIDPSAPAPTLCLRTNEGPLAPIPGKPDLFRLQYVAWQ